MGEFLRLVRGAGRMPDLRGSEACEGREEAMRRKKTNKLQRRREGNGLRS